MYIGLLEVILLSLLFIILSCFYIFIGFKMGKAMKVIEIKKGDSVSYIHEQVFEDEDAYLPEEQTSG